MKVLFNLFPLWTVSWRNIIALVLLHLHMPKQIAHVQKKNKNKQESLDNILKQYNVIAYMLYIFCVWEPK